MFDTVLYRRKNKPQYLRIPFISDPWNFVTVSNTWKFSGFIFLKLCICSCRCIWMRYLPNYLHINKVTLTDLPRWKSIFYKKSWNSVICSQKLFLQIAGTTIRLGAWSSVVVKALRYLSDGPWIDFRWCRWIFQWRLSFRPYHDPGADSASSENEYQEHSWG